MKHAAGVGGLSVFSTCLVCPGKILRFNTIYRAERVG